MSNTIENPAAFFEALCLHDSQIELVEWSPGTMRIAVDDLYSNFSGLPGYPGPHRASIEFHGVQLVFMETDVVRRASVFEFEVHEESAGRLSVEIRLAPGGLIRLTCQSIGGDFDWRSVQAALPPMGSHG